MVSVLAVALRLASEYSDMSVSATGMQAPRPMPPTRRQASNAMIDGDSGSAMVATENSATAARSARRRPTRSATGPDTAAPIATPTSDNVAATVVDDAVNPRWCWSISVGMTTPRTTRSNPSRRTTSQHNTAGHERNAVISITHSYVLSGWTTPSTS